MAIICRFVSEPSTVLCGCLIENENKVNIGKCTNMHPYEFLIKTIRKYKQCWPVTRHLRSYINKLYYFETR